MKKKENKLGIPYWRHVDWSDDGCSLFQCLNCKNGWEARTDPGAEWLEEKYCWESKKTAGNFVLIVVVRG